MNVQTRDLLAAATPRPWLSVRPYGGVVSVDPDTIARDTDKRGADHVEAYGGALVCESASAADKALIVQAVNEYEALLALEASLRAVAGYLTGAYAAHANETLARLDEIRSRR